MFDYVFLASYNAASDKAQFVVIKVFNVLFIIFSSLAKIQGGLWGYSSWGKNRTALMGRKHGTKFLR
jgi:hypothetical protein